MHRLDDMDMEELLRVNIRLTQENNKLLKKMRRREMFNFWGRIIFLLLLVGGAYYAYQHYVKEYVVEFQSMYEEMREGVDTVKTIPTRLGF